MTDPLFLAGSVAVPIGGVLTLDGPEGRHAAKVRRIRVGETVLVADGNGRAVRGVTSRVLPDAIEITVAEALAETPRPRRFVAVQALAKGGRDELAVETMTELGVDEILAWQAARSVASWSGKQAKGLARWAATAREAAKQCRRFTVPTVGAVTTDELCRRIGAGHGRSFVLHESAGVFLDAQSLPPTGDVLFVVGPEGGIAPHELDALTAAGATSVRIADHVLRTSTAGVVALAQLQAMCRFARGQP